ncbi:MAG: hypothetical protein HYY84_00030 [Deltaproteobacteria bacterium]|nr:hypothetical protein [Deltaproteobacteria bacterium]
MTRKGRAHLITGGLLLGLILIIALLWANPMVLVWVLLGIMAVMAYGVLYLLVQARMPKAAGDDEAAEHEGADEADDAKDEAIDSDAELHEPPVPQKRRVASPSRGMEPSREVSREFPNGAREARMTPDEGVRETEPPPRVRSARRTKRPLSE